MTYGEYQQNLRNNQEFHTVRLSGCAGNFPPRSQPGSLVASSRPGHLAAGTHSPNPVYLGYATRNSRAYAAFVAARGSRRRGSLGARRRNPAGCLALSEGALSAAPSECESDLTHYRLITPDTKGRRRKWLCLYLPFQEQRWRPASLNLYSLLFSRRLGWRGREARFLPTDLPAKIRR